MTRFVLAGCVGFGGYLLLAGSIAVSEAITGAALGLLAAIWCLTARVYPERFAFSPTHARTWARALAHLPPETVVAARFLAAAVIRPADGKAISSPFRYGATDDPAERARRATAVLAASLAPASYVVDLEPGRDTALMHTANAGAADDREWLV